MLTVASLLVNNLKIKRYLTIALCLAAIVAMPNATANEQDVKAHLAKIGTRASATLPQRRGDVAKEQMGKLYKVEEYAKQYSNPTLELSALKKMALVSGTSSKEYLMAYIRFKVNQGGKNREEALKSIKKLCAMDPSSYECVQGNALYQVTSNEMRMKLQSFVMHETNRDYQAAVDDMNAALGIPVEHNLRYRYYMMLGNIDGKENEAVLGLEKIVAEDPTNGTFKFAVMQSINELKAQGLANSAMHEIDDPKLKKSAQNKLRKALTIDPKSKNKEYWEEILNSSTYYALIDEADKYLEKEDLKNAIDTYLKATKVISDNTYAHVGLARSYVKSGDEKRFKEEEQKALAYAKKESPSEQARIKQTMIALNGDLLVARAENFEKSNQVNDAILCYEKALQYDNTNVWTAYKLSKLYVSVNDYQKAENTFNKLSPTVKKTSEYAFSRALILESTQNVRVARQVRLPFKGKDQSIDETLARYDESIKIEDAETLYKKGDLKGAIAKLQGIDKPSVKATLADYVYENGQKEDSVMLYEEAIAGDDTLTYAKLRLATVYHEVERDSDAIALAKALRQNPKELSLGNQRNLAELLNDLGQYDESFKAYEDTITQGEKELDDAEVKSLGYNTSANNLVASDEEKRRTVAWSMRNLATIEQEHYEKDDTEVVDRYRKALAIYDNDDNYLTDDALYTKALRTKDEGDDWLRQSIVSHGDKGYTAQNITVQEAIRLIKDSGHPGYSDNKGFVNVLNIATHLLKGKVQLQLDTTRLNAGTLQGGEWNDMFGSCFSEGCNDKSAHKKTATTIALSYDNEKLHVDLGTAPKISGNKTKTNALVGGVRTYFDWGTWSFTPSIYHRAIDNSLLAYFGDKDPRTGIAWGAVKKTGISLSVSDYINERSGIWMNSAFETLHGTNVASNTKFSFMGGYYYHFIYKPNERLTFGPSMMFMHYGKDLSGYTFSQGGYYSPQMYLSTSLSLAYMRRFNNTSIYAQISGSLSHSKTKGIDRYPYKSKIMGISDIDSKSDSDSSTTFGGGIEAAIEQRLGSHLVVGTSISAIKSDDYSPLTGMLYFRYYYDAYNGDLYMPPQGPTPYVAW